MINRGQGTFVLSLVPPPNPLQTDAWVTFGSRNRSLGLEPSPLSGVTLLTQSSLQNVAWHGTQIREIG